MADVFDFKKVSVVVNGHIVTGWMDGSVITAEKNEDNVIPHIGAAGEVSYSESNNNTGLITLNIKQTSPSLPIFVNLAKKKEVFPAQIIDANTNRVKTGGNQCRILKTPGTEWGTEVTGVEIQIYVADYDFTTA